MFYSSEYNIQNSDQVFKELHNPASAHPTNEPMENATLPLTQGLVAIIVLFSLASALCSLNL